MPPIKIVNQEFDDVVQESTMILSLASIAKNVKWKTKMYYDKVSKLQNNLGILNNLVIGTGISILSGITFIVAFLALALSVNVYCKFLILPHVGAAMVFSSNKKIHMVL